ncbi:tetratricopeptide repeat protein [Kitasatospora purpeofusca]|uniref:tetratricopeptide repeat protein n=1 Tax=Kitasatospora purpeofusca TaxID=67352 RepID=UPI0035D74CF1
MNVDDLVWQWGNAGGVPRKLVDALLDHGCVDLLVEAAHRREDWSCAQGAVRGLCAAGEFERAWGVIEPFAATGWQPAVRAGADVLLQWGRVQQALELVRPGTREEDAHDAWRDYAEVLVGAGLVDEAIDALAGRPLDERTLWTLVAVTEGQGRDERVLELLGPIAEKVRSDPGQSEVRHLGDALSAQVRVLERAGRTDEALGLCAADAAARRGWGADREHAALLARLGRVTELRVLATGPTCDAAVRSYVEALEALGRTAEAEAHLRGLVETAEYPGSYENQLLELLMRQGRFEDAVKAVEHTFDNVHDGNLLQAAMVLLAGQGRHDRALELTHGRSPDFLAHNEAFWLRDNRWWLMGESGRARDALTELLALPAEEVDDREPTIARLLAQDGRAEEAVAHLRALPGRRAWTVLVDLLVRQGRFAEAIAAVPDVAAQQEEERRFWARGAQSREATPSDR